tara:strand:- start:3941 stop:5146 length:1206 start_codon:yes stop_codon:yes gene_type:complete
MSIPDESTEPDNDTPAETLEEVMDREFEIFETQPDTDFDPNREEPDPTPTPTPDEDPDPDPEPDPELDTEPEPDPEPDPTPDSDPDPVGDDEFQKSLIAEMKELALDPKPGLKWAELRRTVKAAEAARDKALEEGGNTEEIQKLRLRAEEIDDVRAEAAELRQSLALNDYKSTSEFQTLVQTPANEIKTLASSIESDNGIDPGVILAAIQHPEARVQKSLIEKAVEEGGLDMQDQMRIYRMADQHLQLSATDKALKEHASTRMQELNELQVTERTAAAETQQKALRSGIEGAFAQHEGRIPGFVTDDGLPTEQYEQLKASAASSDLNTIQDASYAIMAATLLPEVLKANKALSDEIVGKNKTLAKYGKVAPKQGKVTQAKANKKQPSTLMEALDSIEGIDY